MFVIAYLDRRIRGEAWRAYVLEECPAFRLHLEAALRFPDQTL